MGRLASATKSHGRKLTPARLPLRRVATKDRAESLRQLDPLCNHTRLSDVLDQIAADCTWDQALGNHPRHTSSFKALALLVALLDPKSFATVSAQWRESLRAYTPERLRGVQILANVGLTSTRRAVRRQAGSGLAESI